VDQDQIFGIDQINNYNKDHELKVGLKNTF